MLTAYVLVVATVLGLLIGSFLNVVIARVPDGRSVVSPGSACPSCGTPIGPRDNIPVVSWLLLRGRSRCCDEPISIRYPIVEASTAVAFLAVTAWNLHSGDQTLAGPAWELPALLYLAAITIALAVIDVEHHRLPDAITFPSYGIGGALLILAALAQGHPGWLIRVAIGGFGLFALYFILWLVYPAGMGFGDVKLAGILGGYLGYASLGLVVTGGFLGFLAGGLGGLVMIFMRRAGMKTQIPYGPYMLAGTWLALVWGQHLVDWYLRTSGLK